MRHDLVIHPPQVPKHSVTISAIARIVTTVGLGSFTVSTVFGTPLPITSVILASAYGAGVAIEQVKFGEGRNPSKLVPHPLENNMGTPPPQGFSALPASQVSTYEEGINSAIPKSRGALEAEPMRPEKRSVLFEEM